MVAQCAVQQIPQPILRRMLLRGFSQTTVQKQGQLRTEGIPLQCFLASTTTVFADMSLCREVGHRLPNRVSAQFQDGRRLSPGLLRRSHPA